MTRYARLCVATCIACLLAVPAAADAAPRQKKQDAGEGRTWITSGFLSYHLQSYYEQHYLDINSVPQVRYIDFNQRNDGIGLEQRLSPDWTVSIGTYDNSYREQSHYLVATWSRKVLTGHARIGLGFGGVTGYEDFTGEKITPTVTPSIGLDAGKRLGVNLLFLPSPVDFEASAFAVQLKWRLR